MDEIANVADEDLPDNDRRLLLGNAELVANALFQRELDEILALSGEKPSARLKRLRELEQCSKDVPLNAAQVGRLSAAIAGIEAEALKKEIDPLVAKHLATL